MGFYNEIQRVCKVCADLLKEEEKKEIKSLSKMTQHLSLKDVKSHKYQRLAESFTAVDDSWSSISENKSQLLRRSGGYGSTNDLKNIRTQSKHLTEVIIQDSKRINRSSLTRIESYREYKNSTNWNEELRIILEEVKNETEKYEKIANLADNFDSTAVTYAKVIISELCFPDSQKTIQPSKIGGLAGGSKYIVQGIMFKIGLLL